MPLIHTRFFAKTLAMQTAANVILPQPKDADAPASPLPVLYLLHGMGDDHSLWLRRTDVERYALEKGIAVVMPDGEMSCYENMPNGQRWHDYIAQELPEIMHGWFPLSDKREETFIAGCSMGGCGSVKIGLADPDRYSAIGCLSSSHTEFIRSVPALEKTLRRAYGDRAAEVEAQTERNAEAAARGDKKILLWHCCGDQDLIRDEAMKTKAFFENIGGSAIEYHFEMFPGRHDWVLWDRALKNFIAALPVSAPSAPLI